MRPDRDLTRTYSRKQFAEKLRRLADAVENEGAFTIQVAGERLRIPADATLTSNMSAKARTRSSSFR
jgi:amphi-Trp domain-containing protein